MTNFCDICSRNFTMRQNLLRHLRDIHNVRTSKTEEKKCAECNFKCNSLVKMKKHIRENHNSATTKLCIYCNKMFYSIRTFNKHLKDVHSLPPILPSQNSNISPQTSAFGGTVQSFFLPSVEDVDFLQFMVDRKQSIQEIVGDAVRIEPKKVQLSSKVKLEKPALDDEEGMDLAIHVNSKMETVYLGEELTDETFFSMLDQMLTSLLSFTAHGSGWMLKEITGVHVKLVSYLPIRGSSYLPLPTSLQSMNCLLNIRNREDNNCFLYCYVAAWHFNFGQSLYDNVGWRMKTSPQTYSASNPLAHQPMGEFQMPMGFNDIPRFENLNIVQVNVFRYQKKGLIPLRISKKQDFPFILDLLLLSDGQAYHYVLIKDLKLFVSNIRQHVPRSGSKICRNCFHVCYTGEIYDRHIQTCFQNEAATIKLPDETNNLLEFTNYQSRWFAPYVIYFDFESLIKPLATCSSSAAVSSSEIIEQHEPCGYCLVVIEHGNPEPVFFKLERSPDCMKGFIDHLQKLAKDIYEMKQLHRNYTGPQQLQTDDCWICGEYMVDEEKVLDHCHATGKFIGFAHSRCNLKRRTVNYIPLFAHNLSNYDLHFICKNLHQFPEDSKINVIPVTDEKYISLSVGIKVASYTDRRGVEKHVYEYLRFADSYRFMAQPLDKLVNNLPPENFTFLDNHFPSKSPEELALLHQKGFYPYSYFDCHEKFEEKTLPKLEKWTNSLHGGQVSISAENLEQANKVFSTFNCRNLGDYHDIYLTVDTLLLACVVEEFRKVTYSTYGLDSAHYFTCSHLSGDAFLKVSKARVELMTDRMQLEMAENLIRGGVSSIFSKRLATMNNSYLDSFDDSKAISYGLLLDANNLYGGIMQNFPLPLGNFQIVDVELSEILSTDKESDVGYVLEVDLDYPDCLHNMHKDFPLAPTKEKIDRNMLSEYQIGLLDHAGSNRVVNPKLVQTLFNKKNYTVHYISLKLYVEMGLRVSKVHRVLRFKQQKWLEPYIRLNTQMRMQSTNKFQESFYKLMNNSCYGKTLESKRNRVNVKLARSREAVLQNSDKGLMKSVNIFDENLVAITSRRGEIYWDTPTLVGACILDLAKFHMFEFHYKVSRLHQNLFFNVSLILPPNAYPPNQNNFHRYNYYFMFPGHEEDI